MSATSTAHAKAVELGRHILRMTTAAGSGHPSSALAIIHVVIDLMYRTMRYDPADPWNPGSDRLVLSIGHAVPAAYAAYADLEGVVGKSPKEARPLTIDDLASLRELHSTLDGHPNPAEGFPFFDAATGSLGQGLSAAAGLAVAARLDKSNKRIFVIAGDGESREGQFWEAADFIVDHRLYNVCLIVSCNGQGQAGPVSHQQSAETVAEKLEAFGWKVATIDGHDPDAIHGATAESAGRGHPTAIIARTVKGWGVDLMLHSNYHGKPVPAAELGAACAQLEAYGKKLGAKAEESWTPRKPGKIAAESARVPIALPGLDSALRDAGLAAALDKKELATRVAWGVAMVALGKADNRIVSLDGDVSNSTYANLFAKEHSDRFFECKIAEQNMITAASGLAAAGKIPFASSFGKFIERGLDQVDMAAITRANIKIVGSHTGVSLAADGPSQMAVTDVAFFRSMCHVDAGGRPACRVFQPSDAVSAYRLTELMANLDGLCYLRTHRPNAPFIYELDETFTTAGFKQIRRGADITLVSAGYMLHTVLSAAGRLADRGISCNVFDAYALPLETDAILDAVQSSDSTILVVEDNFAGGLHAEIAEAAAARGDIRVVGMTVARMPKSARTAEEVFEYCGVGLDQIVGRCRELVGR
ncbi:MAG: transketolase [Phycisphaerae bacterium]|nr:transketolase [Phycisphaerae bacterium]